MEKTFKTKNSKAVEIVDILDSKGMNLELLFATNVLKLKSLHYGYWDQEQKTDLDDIRNAQIRYTKTLADMIPAGVEKILDVGCCIGDNALVLANRGYQVTAISPDANHSKFFDGYDNKNIIFVRSKLEDFETEDRFDLMLFSESQTYFDPEISFIKAQRLLNPKGYILFSDMFALGSDGESRVDFTEEEYLSTAQRYGFSIVSNTDITEKVLPTIKYTHTIYSSYVDPSINLLVDYIRSRSPIKFKLISLLFGNQLKELSKAKNHFDKRLNPDYFSKEIAYKRLLMRKDN